MTKAKARLRAKANAAQKIAKREAGADQPDRQTPPGQFDSGPGSIKGPRMNTGIRGNAVAKKGSARSR